MTTLKKTIDKRLTDAYDFNIDIDDAAFTIYGRYSVNVYHKGLNTDVVNDLVTIADGQSFNDSVAQWYSNTRLKLIGILDRQELIASFADKAE